MKKIIILSLMLLLFTITGCNNKTTINNKSTNTETKEVTTSKVTTTKKIINYSISSSTDKVLLVKDKDEYKTYSFIPTVMMDEEVVENPVIEYESSDINIATVDSNGLITGINYGVAQVKATYKVDSSEYTTTVDAYVLESITNEELNSLSEDYTNLYGRVYKTGDSITLDNPATAIEVYFIGTSLTVNLKGSSTSLYFRAFIDDDTEGEFTNVGSTKNKDITIAKDLTFGIHRVRIVKSSSPDDGRILINSFSTDGEFLKAREKSKLKIEFIGDSITVGFGNLGQAGVTRSTANSDTSKSYAYQVAQTLDADYSIIALEGICVTNSTLNMVTLYEDYSTSNKTAFDPSSFDADIVVLALGENDMWHATDSQFKYSQNEFINDYTEFLKTINEYHKDAYIICMFGMMPAFSTSDAKLAVQQAITNSGLTNIKLIQVSKNVSGSGEHPNAKNTPKVTIERFKENLTTMVGWVREMGATPILLTNNPLNPDIFFSAQGQNKDYYTEVGTPLEWLDKYNEAIREVATELDCYLVDNRITFSEKYYKSYLLDGIHLNAKGNKKFSENLVEFFKENYVNDPSASKVSTEDLYVYLDETTKTKSIVSYDSSYWVPLNEYIKIEASENKIEIYNTNNQYPCIDYEMLNPVACPVENGYIKYDIEIQNINTSIIVYIDGFSPSTDIAGTYFILNSHMTTSIEDGSGDIVGPIHLTGTIKLSDLGVAKTRLHKGCVAISGVRVYAAGNAKQKIIINELSVSIEEIK